RASARSTCTASTRPPRSSSASASPPAARSSGCEPEPWRWSRARSAGSMVPASRRNSGSCSASSPTASSSATAEAGAYGGLADEVVGRDQVDGQGGDEGIGHVGHVRVLQRPQLVGQLVGAEVELLVEVVDLALAVDALAGPLALGAASPNAPVGTIPRLLPAGWLHQAGAAPRADVQ